MTIQGFAVFSRVFEPESYIDVQRDGFRIALAPWLKSLAGAEDAFGKNEVIIHRLCLSTYSNMSSNSWAIRIGSEGKLAELAEFTHTQVDGDACDDFIFDVMMPHSNGKGAFGNSQQLVYRGPEHDEVFGVSVNLNNGLDVVVSKMTSIPEVSSPAFTLSFFAEVSQKKENQPAL